jgi:hypothetical protein
VSGKPLKPTVGR